MGPFYEQARDATADRGAEAWCGAGIGVHEARPPQAIRTFSEAFGGKASLTVGAPGRVNLIGEHTDYNEGWVLPTAIELGTTIAARERKDRELRTFSAVFEAEDRAELDDLRPAKGPEWTRYVRGMVAMLQEAGYELPGADLMITGDLPLSAGLSSSASLEMGVGVAMAALAGVSIEPTELARLGRRAENEILGVQSGLMDQLAVACGRLDNALLIDCRTAAIEFVPVPPEARFLVLDTGVRRNLSNSEYNSRRIECASALAKLQAQNPGMTALRDVTQDLLKEAGSALDERELRRVRHVVTEDERVLRAATALRKGGLQEFGDLMVASHDSLRDDFEVSRHELNAMVEAAISHPDVLGARLTGAGFGGCAVALVEAKGAHTAADRILSAYDRKTGRKGMAYVCRPSGGAAVLTEG